MPETQTSFLHLFPMPHLGEGGRLLCSGLVESRPLSCFCSALVLKRALDPIAPQSRG